MSDPEVPTLADLREALEHIAGGQQCSNYTGPPYCRDPRSGRTRDARYGADRWCDTCIALAALGQREPDTPADDSVRTYGEFEHRYLPETVARRERENETAKEAGRRIAREAIAKAAPATPEGGEPYRPLWSDDAKIEILLARAEENLLSLSMTDVADLASALRSQRQTAPRYAKYATEYRDMFLTQLDRAEELERELAEVRGELVAAKAAHEVNTIAYAGKLAEVRDTPSFRARVTAAVVALVNLWIDRDTENYPRAGQWVVVRAAEDKETPNG